MQEAAAQSMAALAMVTAILRDMRKEGMPKGDIDNMLDDARSLVRAISPSFNDEAGVGALIEGARKLISRV